jgi:hypothetical protein
LYTVYNIRMRPSGFLDPGGYIYRNAEMYNWRRRGGFQGVMKISMYCRKSQHINPMEIQDVPDIFPGV